MYNTVMIGWQYACAVSSNSMCSVFITYMLDRVSLYTVYTESAGPALHGGLGDELHMNELLMNELDDRIMNAFNSRGRLTNPLLTLYEATPISVCVCVCFLPIKRSTIFIILFILCSSPVDPH